MAFMEIWKIIIITKPKEDAYAMQSHSVHLSISF